MKVLLLLLWDLSVGYPIGAKIATDFRNRNICPKEECERILSFTNNSGPLFIIGTVGISMYHSSTIGILLFISHFLGSLCVGFIFRFWKSNFIKNKDIETNINKSTTINNKKRKITSTSLSNLGEVISSSISSSIKTIVIIGGFIVLFSCIISIFESSGLIHILSNLINPFLSIFNIDSSFSKGLIQGIIEITNGINHISTIAIKKISINLILTSFLLGLGGLSIFLQVLSITSTSDLSIKPYIYGKILHSLFAGIFTFILISIFPIFNFDLI